MDGVLAASMPLHQQPFQLQLGHVVVGARVASAASHATKAISDDHVPQHGAKDRGIEAPSVSGGSSLTCDGCNELGSACIEELAAWDVVLNATSVSMLYAACPVSAAADVSSPNGDQLLIAAELIPHGLVAAWRSASATAHAPCANPPQISSASVTATVRRKLQEDGSCQSRSLVVGLAVGFNLAVIAAIGLAFHVMHLRHKVSAWALHFETAAQDPVSSVTPWSVT